MKSSEQRIQGRARRKKGLRKRLFGTSDRPRLSVSRSHKNISAQIIDDLRGVTLAQASTRNTDVRSSIVYGGNIEAAKVVGRMLAERAKAAGIQRVCFDRNGYRFHGRIKGLADAAREAGLEI
jgi:large subunit ribosomal protein L18